MATRMAIAALVFMMMQAIWFGVGAILVLATPLSEQAMVLMPLVVIASMVVAIPLSWWLAPRLRARFWRGKVRDGAADKLLDALS